MPAKELVLKPGQTVQLREAGIALGVVSLVGEGGFSEVYKAVDPRTNGAYAVKVLQRRHAYHDKTAERHQREGTALLHFRHKNIVRVFGMDQLESGQTFLVMDLLEGWTLRELLGECHGRLPIPWALEIMIEICKALETIHQTAVHRDLKPENIHVSFCGKRVRLFDLGIALMKQARALTTPGMAMGTIAYMSPQALQTPDKVDFRADLFAIGVMLYELICGIHPFAVNGELSDDSRSTGYQIVSCKQIPLIAANPAVKVPVYISEIVDKLMQKNPARRPESARELVKILTATYVTYVDEYGADPLTNVSDVSRRFSTPEFGPAPHMSLVSNPFISALPPDPAQAHLSASRRVQPVNGTEALPAIASSRLPSASSVTEELPAMRDGSEAEAGGRSTLLLVEPARSTRRTLPFVQTVTRAREAPPPAAKHVTDERAIVLPPAPVPRVIVTASQPKASTAPLRSSTTWTPVATSAGRRGPPASELPAPRKRALPWRDIATFGAAISITCIVMWPLSNALVAWWRQPPAVVAAPSPMRVPLQPSDESPTPAASAPAPAPVPSSAVLPVASAAIPPPLPPIPTAAAPTASAPRPPRRPAPKPVPFNPWR